MEETIVNTASGPLQDEVENGARDLTLGVHLCPEGIHDGVCSKGLFWEKRPEDGPWRQHGTHSRQRDAGVSAGVFGERCLRHEGPSLFFLHGTLLCPHGPPDLQQPSCALERR